MFYFASRCVAFFCRIKTLMQWIPACSYLIFFSLRLEVSCLPPVERLFSRDANNSGGRVDDVGSRVAENEISGT